MAPPLSNVRPRDRTLAIVIAFVLLKLAFHVVTNGQYGFHRDELATIDDSRYLDWGYVAYPPFTPFVGRVALTLFGPSLTGIRFFGALALSLVIVLSALMARELGGGHASQIVAALAVAISPSTLSASALFQYVAFDFLWWVLIGYGLLRLANTNDPRWWLLIGGAIGLAVETKYTIGLGVIGVVAGVLVSRREDFRSPWLWAGVALSVLIALPNLIWQARHDFISVTFLKSIHARDVGMGRTSTFLRDQLTDTTNPVTIAIWILGLVALLRSVGQRRERLLACFVVVPFVLFWVLNGRGYYAAPLYPLLLAKGAAVSEAWIARLGHASRRVVRVTQAALLVIGAQVIFIVLPIAPLGSDRWRVAIDRNGDLAEQIGWPEMVQTVAGIFKTLPPSEQAHTRVLTGNYGEAGAINLYGPAFGLPEAISPINSYWARGYGDPPPTTVIVLGSGRERLEKAFQTCGLAATLANPLMVHNEENDRHSEIYLCRGPKRPWSEVWPQIRSFG